MELEFTLTKEELLKPLQQVIGVVDKKQLQPILSFVLLNFCDNELIISATDLDIELKSKIDLSPQDNIGKLVLPAKKLLDICKSLPDKANIKLKKSDNNTTKDNMLSIVCNKSRFTLSSLEPESFPQKSEQVRGFSFSINQSDLKNLLNSTSFAIAQQDVRHYLMGMLWEFNHHEFRVVSSDGHRLAKASLTDPKIFPNSSVQVIIPRKSITELIRLLDIDSDTESGDGFRDKSEVFVTIGDNSLQLTTNSLVFTSKLIDSKFPDYGKVFPTGNDFISVEINKDDLKQILTRVSILTNEKHRAVRLCFTENQLVIIANNPEQEQAEEVIELDNHNSQELNQEICVNVGYLLDVLNKFPVSCSAIKIQIKQQNAPILITPVYPNLDIKGSADSIHSKKYDYIIMPMCL